MKGNKLFLILLVIIQILAYAFVNPRGNFSINDDWFYAREVNNFNFVNYEVDSLVTPSLIGQVWYAKVITKTFGFSLEILRFTTIILSILLIIAFYLLLTELKVKRELSFFLSLLLFFNPLFFYLSVSFMTDIPALAFVVFALLFFAKYINRQKWGYFILASLYLIYAIIIRQSYLFLLPLSFIFIYDKNKISKKSLVYYFFSLLLLFGLYYFLKLKHWWPSHDIDLHRFENIKVHFIHIKEQIFSIWQYLGFFFLPISLAYLFQKEMRYKLLKFSLIISSLAFISWRCFMQNKLFPYFGNIISIYGLGPRDPNGVLSGSPIQIISLNERIILTLLVALSAGIILAIVIDVVCGYLSQKVDERKMILFVLLSAISQVAVVFAFLSFDRYYLPIFLFLLIVVGISLNKLKISFINIIFLLIIGFFVLTLTRLSLNEYRLKWQVANGLKNSGIAISDIDAGYEWLGWNWYGKTPAWRLPFWDADYPWYISRLYPDNERIYVITYEPVMEGYKLTNVFFYGNLFKMQFNLYLHKKII